MTTAAEHLHGLAVAKIKKRLNGRIKRLEAKRGHKLDRPELFEAMAQWFPERQLRSLHELTDLMMAERAVATEITRQILAEG